MSHRLKPKEREAHKRAYFQRPEIKARKREYMREYRLRLGVKVNQQKYAHDYRKSPEGKAIMREYLNRPVVQVRRRKYMRNYHQQSDYKAKWRIANRIYRQKLRMAALIHYGGNPPKCACCGEQHEHFLAIDHINGGGCKHRRAVGKSPYVWLKLNKYPAGFQVLCHNCNSAKGYYGICPHEEERTRVV